MYKRLVSLFIAFSLLLCFAGCVTEPEEYVEADHRWYADFTDTLIPRDDYGELYAYIGGHKDDMDYVGQLYGLMTLDGKIVVDPVYNRHRELEFDGTKYYSMEYVENDLYEGGEYSCQSTLMKTDGSWAVMLDGQVSCLSENRIVTSKLSEYFKVYDYDGNLIFEGSDTQSIATDGNGFYNGLMVAFDFHNDYSTVVYDENGNIVLDGLDYCGPFATNKAVASYNRDEGYGIISSDGEWLLEPVYDEIDAVDDGKYFVATVGGTEELYDSDLKLLRSREWSGDYRDESYFDIYGNRLHKFYSNMDGPDEYYRDAFTDEIVSCKENGLPATKLIETADEENPLFSGTDENGVLWVFDCEGKVFRSFENGGNFFMVSEDFYFVENEGVSTYYKTGTHEKIFSAYSTYEKMQPVETLTADCPYISVGDLEYVGDTRYEGVYHLYNYETGEYVFKDCEECYLEKFEDNIYITVIYGDKISIYDENLNTVLQVKNHCEGMTYQKMFYDRTLEVHERRAALSSVSPDFAAQISELIAEIELNFDEMIMRSSHEAYEYKQTAESGKDAAVQAFEEIVTCAFYSGTVGKTLVASYEYAAVKQAVDNAYSAEQGEFKVTPVGLDAFDVYEKFEGEYAEKIAAFVEKIKTCATAEEAEKLSAELDDLIATVKDDVLTKLREEYKPMGEEAVDTVTKSLENYLSLRKTAENKYTEAAEAFDNELFTAMTKLYARYETAQWLLLVV